MMHLGPEDRQEIGRLLRSLGKRFDVVLVDSTDGGASAAGATITFSGTLNATTAGIEALTLDAGTAGNIDFDAAVGGTTLLSVVVAPGPSRRMVRGR